jgi:hypothetical protein
MYQFLNGNFQVLLQGISMRGLESYFFAFWLLDRATAFFSNRGQALDSVIIFKQVDQARVEALKLCLWP